MKQTGCKIQRFQYNDGLLNRVLLTVTVLATFVVLLLFYVVTLTRSFFNYHPRCNDIKQFHVCSSVFDQF